jgi:hypothetical protein
MNLLQKILLSLSILVVSIGTLPIALTYSLIKCNNNDNIYCKSVNKIKERCLNNDFKSIQKLISALEVKVDAKPYRNALDCGLTEEEMLEKLTKASQDRIDKECNFSQNDEDSTITEEVNDFNSNECIKACEESFVTLDKCNDENLLSNLDLEVDIAEDSEEGKNIMDRLYDTFTQKPQQYINYFITEPFGQLSTDLYGCSIDVGCSNRAVENFINKVKEVFKALFDGFLEGVSDSLKAELQSYLDIGKMFTDIIKHIASVFGNFGSYLSEDKWLGFLPKSIDFNKFKDDLFKPFNTVIDSIKALFNLETFKAILNNKAEEMLSIFSIGDEKADIPAELKYIGKQAGELTGNSLIIALKLGLTIITSGTSSSTLLTTFTNIASNIASQSKTLQKVFIVAKLVYKKGLEISSKVNIKVNKIVKNIKSLPIVEKYVIKGKNLLSKIDELKDKGYVVADNALDRLLSTIPDVPSKVKDLITQQFQSKVDLVTCAPYRLSKRVAYESQYLQIAYKLNSSKQLASINGPIIANTDKLKRLEDSTKTDYGCINIVPAKEEDDGQCDVNVDKSGSSGYRGKFASGFKKSENNEKIADYYEEIANQEEIFEIMCTKDLNHRIPAELLKTYKNYVKKYLKGINVYDINEPVVTELLSPFTNRIIHRYDWQTCIKDYESRKAVIDKIVSSCITQVECNGYYLKIVKEDPYFIRYSDIIRICNESYRYGVYNIYTSQDLFKSKEKEYSNSSKVNKLYLEYSRKN